MDRGMLCFMIWDQVVPMLHLCIFLLIMPWRHPLSQQNSFLNKFLKIVFKDKIQIWKTVFLACSLRRHCLRMHDAGVPDLFSMFPIVFRALYKKHPKTPQILF